MPFLVTDHARRFCSFSSFFSEKANLDWIQSMVLVQFTAFKGISDFGLLLRMCLATMLHHREWINMFLPFNHVVKTSSVCLRNVIDIKMVEDNSWIRVTYPWEDKTLQFLGVPPHCTVMQHIAEVRKEQKNFYLSFSDKIKAALTEYGVNAGSLSEEKVNSIMSEFYTKFEEQLNR
jgi:hypothetical protein